MKGSFLKKKIEDAGFSAAEVAKALNITPQNLNSKFNSGNVKVDFLFDIVRFTRKPLTYYLDGCPEALGVSLDYKQKIDKVAEPFPVYAKKDLEMTGILMKMLAKEVAIAFKPKFDEQDERIGNLADRLELKEEFESLKKQIESTSKVAKG